MKQTQKLCKSNGFLMNSDYNCNKYNKSNVCFMNCDWMFNDYNKSNAFLCFFDFKIIESGTFDLSEWNVVSSIPMVSKSKNSKHSFDALYILRILITIHFKNHLIYCMYSNYIQYYLKTCDV